MQNFFFSGMLVLFDTFGPHLVAAFALPLLFSWHCFRMVRFLGSSLNQVIGNPNSTAKWSQGWLSWRLLASCLWSFPVPQVCSSLDEPPLNAHRELLEAFILFTTSSALFFLCAAAAAVVLHNHLMMWKLFGPRCDHAACYTLILPVLCLRDSFLLLQSLVLWQVPAE